ncbi:hypothetical protein MRB53_017725 [Persea americana]|uniref:Uncharacterized protein n=1 Tax=Persea americana TaxID=3435 RepID=A0ACC2M6S5_PERAE|nr:hypothetical protein MRB53_017725 [Persea americana]
MSSPAEFYNSLPPVIKAYGSLCLLTTTAYQLGLLNPVSFALIYDAVISRFQVWRLVTNFFFLGKFSINFGICLLMMCVALASLFFDIFWKSKIWGPAREGPFERRTADFLWMMLFGAFSLLLRESAEGEHAYDPPDEWTSLIKGQRTYMALSTIPPLWSPFLGVSLVFMLLYVWSREFPNALISIYRLVTLKAFYLPWAMLALDVIFGSPLTPDRLES